jgi:beta-galactosidase
VQFHKFRGARVGRITVVGTVPDQHLAADLMRWLVPCPAGGWTADDSVTVSTGTGTAGTRLHVLHNWSWDEATAAPSSKVTDMLGGGRHAPGEPITLGPWDVRLFRGDGSRDQGGSENGS